MAGFSTRSHSLVSNIHGSSSFCYDLFCRILYSFFPFIYFSFLSLSIFSFVASDTVICVAEFLTRISFIYSLMISYM